MNRVKEIAMTFVGTPHITGGTIKGKNGGVDCANLPLMIYDELGYTPLEKGHCNSTTWFFKGEQLILPRLEKDFIKVEHEDLRNGDLIAYTFGKSVGHLSMVVDIEKGWVIHSCVDEGVEIVPMDAPCFLKRNGRSREHSCWRLKERIDELI